MALSFELALLLVDSLLDLRVVIGGLLQVSLQTDLGDGANLDDLDVLICLGLHVYLILS